MIFASIVFFALAAVFGVIMLSYLLTGKNIPKGLAIIHGPLAVIGLVLLIIYSLKSSEGAWLPVGIFAVAAVGGLILFHQDLTAKAPKWLGVVHGLAAVTGFVTLLVFAYQHH
jgi:hypothetical protein